MDPTLQKVFEQHLGVLLLAIFLSVLIGFFAWYKNYFRLPVLDHSAIKITPTQVLVAFIIYFGVSFFIPFIVQLFGSVLTSTSQVDIIEGTNLVSRGVYLNLINMSALFIGFMIFVSILNKEARIDVVGKGSYLGFTKNIRNFGMGMLTWLISFPIILAVSQLASIFLVAFNLPSHEQVAVLFLKSTMSNPLLFTLTALFIVFIVPTIEEILFRGFLQNVIVKYCGRGLGIIFNSLIFAFFHFSMSQGFGNIEIIPSIFVLSCFLGFIYYRQKSIFASIGTHATFNAVNVIMLMAV